MVERAQLCDKCLTFILNVTLRWLQDCLHDSIKTCRAWEHERELVISSTVARMITTNGNKSRESCLALELPKPMTAAPADLRRRAHTHTRTHTHTHTQTPTHTNTHTNTNTHENTHISTPKLTDMYDLCRYQVGALLRQTSPNTCNYHWNTRKTHDRGDINGRGPRQKNLKTVEQEHFFFEKGA